MNTSGRTYPKISVQRSAIRIRCRIRFEGFQICLSFYLHVCTGGQSRPVRLRNRTVPSGVFKINRLDPCTRAASVGASRRSTHCLCTTGLELSSSETYLRRQLQLLLSMNHELLVARRRNRFVAASIHIFSTCCQRTCVPHSGFRA